MAHSTHTMTAKASATAAPPTPVGPIPPPILSMNFEAIPTELLRGPLVLLVALSYLVFPALLNTSKETQLGLLPATTVSHESSTESNSED